MIFLVSEKLFHPMIKIKPHKIEQLLHERSIIYCMVDCFIYV